MGIRNFLQKASASELVRQLNLVVISKKNASEWELMETYVHKFRFKCSLEWATIRCGRIKEVGFVGDPVGEACDHV